MSELKSLTYDETEAILISDDDNIGTLIGISKSGTKIWKCAVYIGNGNLLMLFEKGKSIDKVNFDQLLGIKNLTRETMKQSVQLRERAVRLDNLISEDVNFDIYKLNMFHLSSREKITAIDLVKVLQFNLSQLEHFEEADIISFNRGLYSHHALLTDSGRMIVTHRWGEPENLAGAYITSRSVLGIPTEKAQVSEDFILEVAGHRKMTKSNESYDCLHMPRSREEIIQEAKKRIGEKGYSVSSNNCQHFVSSCRNGTAYSPEVQGVLNGAAFVGSILFAGLATLVASKFLTGSDKDKEKEKSQPI